MEPIFFENLQISIIIKFPFQTNHSDWQNTGATARHSKWTVNIKPCLQYHFKIVLVSLKGQTVKNPQLDLSQTLGPATQEQLKESKYLPEVPTDFSYHRSCHSKLLFLLNFCKITTQ